MMPIDTIILDTNLLVLLIVGRASRHYIGRHKRLRAYSQADFESLTELLSRASRVMVTPNTLTEASNLVGQIAEPARWRIYEQFRALANVVDERYLESRRAVEHKEFLRLGLTDSVLLQISPESQILLTTDLELYLAATARGVSAVNFNHYRQN